jgi:predicted XRE-type DNA-binding protein
MLCVGAATSSAIFATLMLIGNLRARLAAAIIGVLGECQLTLRAAQEMTGVAAADFSRIRKANLGRFTIDRLMAILAKLGQEVEMTINVHPRRALALLERRS